MKQRTLGAIALHGIIEKNLILLSLYWKNKMNDSMIDNKKVIWVKKIDYYMFLFLLKIRIFELAFFFLNFLTLVPFAFVEFSLLKNQISQRNFVLLTHHL